MAAIDYSSKLSEAKNVYDETPIDVGQNNRAPPATQQRADK
jgi:hypothetical protein